MRARPKSQILRSQFSLTRMLEGLRSRWTTPAEWTYFRPRCCPHQICVSCSLPVDERGSLERRWTHQDLVEEILDELLLEGARGEEAVEVGAEQFGDEIAVRRYKPSVRAQGTHTDVHVLKRRDEDVAEADDLEGGFSIEGCRVGEAARIGRHTFSCRKCFSSLSSRYVRLDRTGVLKGFMIFLTATACPVSWSFAELCKG